MLLLMHPAGAGEIRQQQAQLALRTASGWQAFAPQRAGWTWMGLRAEGAFHELRSTLPGGAVAWAWVSVRSGTVTWLPGRPFLAAGKQLLLPTQAAAVPEGLRAWGIEGGELKVLSLAVDGELAGLHALQHWAVEDGGRGGAGGFIGRVPSEPRPVHLYAVPTDGGWQLKRVPPIPIWDPVGPSPLVFR